MGTGLGVIVFVGTIVGLWLLVWLANRHADRINKTSSAMRRAEQKALAVVRSDPASEAAVEAWQEVLRQGRELNNDLVCGKALLVLSSVSLQRKEFLKAVSYCDDAIPLLRTEKTRGLLANALVAKALAAEKLGREMLAREALLKALRLNRDIANAFGELEVLNLLGANCHRAGNRTEAEKYYKLTLDLARETGFRQIEAHALHNLGTLAHQDGRLEEGLTFLQQALAVKREISDVSAFETMNNIGSIHYQRGAVELAEGIWTEALNEARKSGKPAASLLGNIAEIKFARGESLEGIELRKEALKVKREAGDQPKVAQQLAWLAGKYLGIGELEQARDYCEQSLKIAQSTQNEKLQASGLQNLATYYSKIGDLNQAIALSERALTLCKESGDRRNEIVALNNLGTYAYVRGEFTKAEALLSEALRLADHLEDSKLQAAALSGTGLLKKDLGEPRTGLTLVMQAAEMRRARRDRRHECSSLANAAGIEIDLGLTKLALDHASRAAELARITNNPEVEVISRLLIGAVYRERGELQKAKEITEQAAASANKAGVVRNRLWARKNMGVISIYLGEFESAISNLTEAVHEAHRCGFSPLETMILADLSSAEISHGDIATGIAHAESALKSAENMRLNIVIGNSWYSIGAGHQQLKQYDAALTALGLSLRVREAIEHCRGKADTYRKLAEVQLAVGDVARARESYRQSLNAFRFLGNEPIAHQLESALRAAEL